VKVAYIAGPYRAQTPHKILENIRAAEQVALRYWKAGYAVICPHMNTRLFDGEAPDDTWFTGDLEILRRCDVVVAMQTWQKSHGARVEAELAINLGIEVIYDGQPAVDPRTPVTQVDGCY
jgi:hypothetical protein